MSKPTQYEYQISDQSRSILAGHQSFAIWLTGLPSSGKSTIANLLETTLHERKIHTYVLDGDDLRKGLCSNLGFSIEDRKENIKRVSEVAKLMAKAGLVVIVSLVSPLAAERMSTRRTLTDHGYFEVFIKTPLEEYIKRDPKGLYKLALNGDLLDFTGISSPFEDPTHPELIIDTTQVEPMLAARQIIEMVQTKINPSFNKSTAN